jgi:hypothetical protein
MIKAEEKAMSRARVWARETTVIVLLICGRRVSDNTI